MGQSESTENILRIKAWKSKADYIYPTPKDHPESDLIELNQKPSTAIAFSGSGSRAMMMAFGFLSGLRDIGVLRNLRYIGGTSGGSWATIIYLYGRLNDDDNIFLGPIVNPEYLTLDILSNIHPDCVRQLASHNFSLEEYVKGSFDRASAWMDSIADKIMKPAGIVPGKLFSWNSKTVADILDRNPNCGITESDFLLPRKENGPYMVIGWTLIGPEKTLFDIAETARDYRFIEVTPLYVGQFYSRTSSYGAKKFLVGGAIEPFAFALRGGAPPANGLAPHQFTGDLQIPKPEKMLDLSSVSNTTSFIARSTSYIDTLALLDSFFSWTYDYWSPAEESPSVTRTLFADAQSVQNDPLIPFIQRGVEKIINVSSSSVIINYAELTDYSNPLNWKISNTVSAKYIDPTIASFFGIIPTDLSFEDRAAIEYSKNHIFVTSEFQDLIEGLISVSKRGIGTFYQKLWTTVDNPHYGIRGGQRVNVTFFFLQPSKEWESKLPEETYNEVFNNSNPNGWLEGYEFDKFPLYDSQRFHLTERESNLLCHLVGWNIIQNKEFFSYILS